MVEKGNIHASQQTEEEMSIMKAMFRTAYFLFSMELPHTTKKYTADSQPVKR